MRELSLFTGMGGGVYGSMILGWDTVAYVEKNEHCQAVIKQRQADGWFDKGNIYGDIAEFNKNNARDYTGRVDIITGGFPCQPHSVAGKRQGTGDERYLFDEIIKTIQIIQPSRLFFENVTGLFTSNAITEIFESLYKLGYRCKPPLVLGSADCGNIHKRERIWIYGSNCDSERTEGSWSQAMAWQSGLSRRESLRSLEDMLRRPDLPEPVVCRMDDELPAWGEQLRAIGNGQDPIAMATAYKLLSEQCH